MFQVADHRFHQEPQRPSQTVSQSQVTSSPVHQHTSTVLIAQGMTTMDPPPSIVHIDQNLLEELRKRFPEVPESVVMTIIQHNRNQREECMMALTRQTPHYGPASLPHNTCTSSLVFHPSPDPHNNVSNGVRKRSDSTGSRGSLPNATGQSPTSQQFFPQSPPHSTAVLYYHSTSDPVASPINDNFITPGPKTAPIQHEQFRPFPNIHNTGAEYAEALHNPMQYYNPPQWGAASAGPSSGHYPKSGMYGSQQPPSVPARPHQFDRSFPPAQQWDTSFSPGSPNTKPASHGGTPTHVPVNQSPVMGHRHSLPWESLDATSQRHGYPLSRPDQPGPSVGQGDPPSSTYITTFHHQIRPSSEQTRNPAGININMGSAHDDHYNMSHLNRDLPPPIPKRPAHTFHLGSRPSVMDNRLVRPPSMSVLTTIPQSPLLPLKSPDGVLPPGNFERTPSSEGHPLSRASSSTGEDFAYTQSLLVHQKARLEKLQQDMNALLEHRNSLKQCVAQKEHYVLQAERNKLDNKPGIGSHDLQKVREENRTLQVDSHLLTLEFDRITKGKAVIGIANDEEDFYARIPPGQGVKSVSSSSESSSTNTTSTSSSHISSHPPAPPSALANQLGNLNETVEEPWSCSACTFDNHPELTLCEICNMPRVGRR